MKTRQVNALDIWPSKTVVARYLRGRSLPPSPLPSRAWQCLNCCSETGNGMKGTFDVVDDVDVFESACFQASTHRFAGQLSNHEHHLAQPCTCETGQGRVGEGRGRAPAHSTPPARRAASCLVKALPAHHHSFGACGRDPMAVYTTDPLI